MQCTPIYDFRELEAAPGEMLELRLDQIPHTLQELRELTFTKPVIFTLRSLENLEEYVALKPDYIDLPHHIAQPLPNLLSSYHNFERTPDLDSLLKQMRKTPARFYKIACQANSMDDAFRMLEFAEKQSDVLGISLGLHGKITRLFAKPWSYVAHREARFGQYFYGKMPYLPKKLYGLIGDVTKSTSDQYHTKIPYLIMPITASELPRFMEQVKRRFAGLSVTIPLKEEVMPYLDEIDQEAALIGAVNTIVNRDGLLVGYNTDGKGALDALGEVQNKRITVIGAGGAAKAIVFEAVRRGAEVLILNRTAERAQELAAKWGCKAASLATHEPYDILVNTTSQTMPIAVEYIDPYTTVMDIQRVPTKLVEEAKKRHCTIVEGQEMFVNQAKGQYALWGIP
ncbi:MAG: type I 3-dehydroquinate dehydratase [Chlamydiales bacterium]